MSGESIPQFISKHEFSPLGKIIFNGMRRVAASFPPEQSLEERKSGLLDRLSEEHQAGYFKIDTAAFEQIVREAESLKTEDMEEWLRIVALKLTLFFETHFSSMSEVEDALKNSWLSQNKNLVNVNRGVVYEVDGPYMEIHISTILTNNPAEIRSIMIDGFKKIATELGHDDNLKNIQKIGGHSWIAYRKTDLVEGLGFTVTYRNDKTQEARVAISREKFLELYGVKES